MKIYVLIHRRQDVDSFDEKEIGYYSSYEKALNAKKKRKHVQGFVNYPNGFRVDIYQLDADSCLESIML